MLNTVTKESYMCSYMNFFIGNIILLQYFNCIDMAYFPTDMLQGTVRNTILN